MKKLILYITGLLLFAIIQLSCNRDEDLYSYSLEFFTNEYAPFNYTEDNALKGLGPSILQEISQNLNFEPNVTVGSWSDMYDAALNTPNGVLFSAVLNADRQDLFKWAGPIATTDWVLYMNPQHPVAVSTLDEAKNVNRIGVIQDDAMHQYLSNLGFTNLVFCEDQPDAVSRLLAGEIDLYPAIEIPLQATLEEMGKSIYSLKKATPLITDMVYFAFNPEIPDEVVNDFQVQINRFKKNGFLQSMTEEYFHTSDFPGTFQFYTEQYPPLTYQNAQGEITGYGTDIVKEIMIRKQQYHPIKLSTWNNGYQLALVNPNFCLFTMDRTEAREDLFQWVGPIGTNTTWFYTKSGSHLPLSSVEEARNLESVGVVSSWFSTQKLVSDGFTNLVFYDTPEAMTIDLFNGTLDALVITDITFPEVLTEMNYEYSAVTPQLALMASDFYISFSKSTDTAIVTAWQNKLDEMKSDGTFEAIHEKWFPFIK